MSVPYDLDFYKKQGQAAAVQSAEILVPLLIRLVEPSSVVDVGCGVGVWAAAFHRHGVTDCIGIDGPWVPRSELLIPAAQFLERDLVQGLIMPRKFDLLLSLEVAEHLAPSAAADFVAGLVGLGPVVAFSAAIPHQGGVHHVNEQWPAYWAQHFAVHGYTAVDCIRPQVLLHPQLTECYGQNLILYVAPRVRAKFMENWIQSLASAPAYPLPLVHPETYARLVDAVAHAPNRLGLIRVLRALPGLFVQGMQMRWRRWRNARSQPSLSGD
jgi:SAM-dependent methyltransferase